MGIAASHAESAKTVFRHRIRSWKALTPKQIAELIQAQWASPSAECIAFVGIAASPVNERQVDWIVCPSPLHLPTEIDELYMTLGIVLGQFTKPAQLYDGELVAVCLQLDHVPTNELPSQMRTLLVRRASIIAQIAETLENSFTGKPVVPLKLDP